MTMATAPSAPAGQQPAAVEPIELAAAADRILQRHPAVGLALGVIHDGRLAFVRSHGVADIGSARAITQDTVFRIGSITKTMTAIAVMQLWESGLVDLDAPVDRYLRAFRLVPRHRHFGQPSLRQLLTHTSGIPDVRHLADLRHLGWGAWDARPPILSVPFGELLPSLATYYGDGLAIVVEPGSAFAYSNHAFATVGRVVEEVSGEPLDRYLRDHLFGPLGMDDTGLVRSERLAGRLATGYGFGRGGPRPVPDRDWIGAGADGVYSTLSDLGRYAAALLGGGANDRGSVLQPQTLALMLDRQYETHPALPAMGLGFFLTDAAGRRIVSHDGILPGFNSHLSIAPDAGVGLILLTNGSSGAMRWIPGEMDGLMRRVLRIEDLEPPAVAHRPEQWSEIVGRYGLPPRIGDARGRLALGPGLEVLVSGGRPVLRLRWPIPALLRGVPLVSDDPADPLAFRTDLGGLGLGMLRLRFRRAADGRRVMHTDLGGQPVSFPETRTTPASRAAGVCLAAGLAAGGVALAVRSARRQPRGTCEVGR